METDPRRMETSLIMSVLIISNTQCVSALERKTAHEPSNVVLLRFISAYEELNHLCPDGDLRIHLSIEVDEMPNSLLSNS